MDTAPTDTDTTTEATSPEFGAHGYDDDRLHRAGDGRMVAGVAQGVAEYFDIDPTLVRIGFVAATLLGGLAIPLYVAAWLLIPAEGADASVVEELLAHERSR